MENTGIGSWIDRRRRKSADRVAVINNDTALSYPDFAHRIDRFANALADRGVVKGDRVAYLGDNHPAFLETLFATTNLGAIFVPLNTRLAPPEIRYALQDSGSCTLVLSDTLQALAVSGSSGTEVSHRIIVREATYATKPDRIAAGAESVVVEDLDDVLSADAPVHRDVPVTLADPCPATSVRIWSEPRTPC